jgi:PHP family Zn ribbon phosphoesterase
MSNAKTTHCPNCGIDIDSGIDIDVNELLYQQLNRQSDQKYRQYRAADQAKFKSDIQAIGADVEVQANKGYK